MTTIPPVFHLRLHLRLLAWLTLLVMGLGVLAPAVVQARAAPPTLAHWQEICTASGIVRVDAAPAATDRTARSNDTDDGSTPGGQTCLGCLLHGVGWALPPGSTPAWLPPPAVNGLPPAHGTAPALPTAAWVTPPAHAPPGLR